MMKECTIKNMKIGEGKPKICLPIVGQNDQDIFETLSSFQKLTYDLIELRIDFYQDILDMNKVQNLLKKLRHQSDKPILFTYRSKREGGNIQLTDEQYKELITNACMSKSVDLIDIELMSGNILVYELVNIVHQNDIKVMMSFHDFHQTPSISDMMDYLEKMEVLGADILKLAVMPQSYKDVIRLLDVTMEMSHKLEKPLVTMSMGKLGKISRMSGELTGSCITFACVDQSSAPGQMHVNDMNIVLEAIHND